MSLQRLAGAVALSTVLMAGCRSGGGGSQRRSLTTTTSAPSTTTTSEATTTTRAPTTTAAPRATTTSTVKTVRLGARLSGANEVPGPGDPDGTGTATLIVEGNSQLCYDVTVARIDRPIGLHIREAAAGKNGPLTLLLQPPPPTGDSHVSGCVPADAGTLSRITAKPSGFYLNVPTEALSGGAVRSQLRRV